MIEVSSNTPHSFESRTALRIGDGLTTLAQPSDQSTLTSVPAKAPSPESPGNPRGHDPDVTVVDRTKEFNMILHENTHSTPTCAALIAPIGMTIKSAQQWSGAASMELRRAGNLTTSPLWSSSSNLKTEPNQFGAIDVFVGARNGDKDTNPNVLNTASLLGSESIATQPSVIAEHRENAHFTNYFLNVPLREGRKSQQASVTEFQTKEKIRAAQKAFSCNPQPSVTPRDPPD